jgi:hypothetical protein
VIYEIARVSWNDLVEYLSSRQVETLVIDSMPERAKAREIASSYTKGKVWLALYPSGLKTLFVREDTTRLVKIHRTEAIDTVLSRFRDDKILILPRVRESSEYVFFSSHVCSVARKYREVRGEYEAYYEESGADHYLHALVYLEIAGRLMCSVAEVDEASGNFLR